VVMNQGRVEQIGTPLDVYERPQTLFAAQFIGSPAMNILDGHVESGEIRLSNGVRLPGQSSYAGAVKVGIRPEHLVMSDSGEIEVEVGLTEPLGATTLLHGQLKQSVEAVSASLTGVYHHKLTSETLKLSVGAENIHLFEVNTGQRL